MGERRRLVPLPDVVVGGRGGGDTGGGAGPAHPRVIAALHRLGLLLYGAGARAVGAAGAHARDAAVLHGVGVGVGEGACRRHGRGVCPARHAAMSASENSGRLCIERSVAGLACVLVGRCD